MSFKAKRVSGFLVLLIGLFFLVSEASATSYTLTEGMSSGPSNPFWDGGAFLVNGSFLTFCLETNEYFSFGTTYNGTIDPYAVLGGTGGAIQIDPVNNPGLMGDPISDQTAWLYLLFLNTPAYQTPSWEIVFQITIWSLESENLSSPYNLAYLLPDGSGHNVSWFIANNTPPTDWKNDQVMVLNLYTGNTLAQSHLIRVPEPSTLLLLGLGLIGLGVGVRRRR